MKIIRIFLFLFIFLTALIIGVETVSADWHTGARRSVHANGITSLISTPASLRLIALPSSGESNWISTYNVDQAGKRNWLQAGWRMYNWYSTPKQYVEWCINCIGEQGTYEVRDNFATQDWGTTISYWVFRDTDSRWCAYTENIMRFCINNLHPGPVDVIVSSEVHTSTLNELYMTFYEVRYKDPSDNVFKLFNSQTIWFDDFPYQFESFSNSYFQTYRSTIDDVFLPFISR